MPFIVKTDTQQLNRHGKQSILNEINVPDKRVTLDQIKLAENQKFNLTAPLNGLIWFHVLKGTLKSPDKTFDYSQMTVITSGFSLDLLAMAESELLIGTVQDATIYEKDFKEKVKPILSFDWTKEPVLKAEHDSRERIYLASKGLLATEVIKGEMITYPKGASGGAHHHEGAHHFQFVIKGEGVAVLDGEEFNLNTGDVLYNLENEVHYFYNKEESDFVFIEYFIPGESKTVWQPDAYVCGWVPTGIDSQGRKPSRDLSYHIHGQGDV
jgi:quercetin dioxygenase-like cupin family protein